MARLNQRLPWIFAAAAGVGLFAAFTVWAGIPTDERAGIFWAQMGIFFIVTCVFVLLYWHLMARPLASNLKKPLVDSLPARLRQGISVVQTGGALALVVGALWDEIWHRRYGIPFGDDFFWPPHLLMYFGFLTFIAVGFWALGYLNLQLKGNFQQRFRSNTPIGLYILSASFMLYSLVSDPFWHWTFGEDLTTWSVPHLIMLAAYTVALCVTVYVYRSTLPPSPWRSILKIRYADVLPLLAFASLFLIWLQLMLIDWDSMLTGTQPESFVWYRPEWLMAALIVASAVFIGVLATRILRCAGAATLIGLLALAIRFGLIQIFDTDLVQYVSAVVSLLPLIAIDLWTYYCCVMRKREPEWRGVAAAAVAGMTLNAFVIRDIYILHGTDNLAYALAVVCTAIGLSWFSHQVANAMLSERQSGFAVENETALIRPQVAFSLLGGFAVFMFFFIATAAPPV